MPTHVDYMNVSWVDRNTTPAFMDEVDTADSSAIVSMRLYDDSHSHYFLVKSNDNYFIVSSQMRFPTIFSSECTNCKKVISQTWAHDEDIYETHEYEPEVFIWDTDQRSILPNRFKGYVNHIADHKWDIFGDDDRSGLFFINKLTHA